jgi:hypothetical protein
LIGVGFFDGRRDPLPPQMGCARANVYDSLKEVTRKMVHV